MCFEGVRTPSTMTPIRHDFPSPYVPVDADVRRTSRRAILESKGGSEKEPGIQEISVKAYCWQHQGEMTFFSSLSYFLLLLFVRYFASCSVSLCFSLMFLSECIDGSSEASLQQSSIEANTKYEGSHNRIMSPSCVFKPRSSYS